MAKMNKCGLKHLKDNLDFISLLHKTRTARKCRDLLKIATPEQILTVCECIKSEFLAGSKFEWTSFFGRF